MVNGMIGEIVNYKLKDFIRMKIELIEEYASALTFIEPIETKKELFYMPLRFVDFVKTHLASDNIEDILEIIGQLTDRTHEEVLEIRVVEFYRTLKGIKKQLEEIIKLEKDRLSGNAVDFRWEAVNGSERLAPFGIFNTLDNLSGGDITKWDEIHDMPYDKVFTKLFMDTVRADIEIEKSKIKHKI